jgi:hypothetical protein
MGEGGAFSAVPNFNNTLSISSLVMITVCNKHYHTKTAADQYVGRGNVLGNPFTHKAGTLAKFICKDRDEAVNSYRTYLLEKLAAKDPEICAEMNRLYKLAKAGDLNLVCYCAPQRCHADILKEVLESKING